MASKAASVTSNRVTLSRKVVAERHPFGRGREERHVRVTLGWWMLIAKRSEGRSGLTWATVSCFTIPKKEKKHQTDLSDCLRRYLIFWKSCSSHTSVHVYMVQPHALTCSHLGCNGEDWLWHLGIYTGRAVLSHLSLFLRRKVPGNTNTRKWHKKGAYQVCYDVMVTFDMFPHTDSLDRDTERDRTLFLCCLPTLHADKPGAM